MKYSAKRDSDGAIIILMVLRGTAQDALDKYSKDQGDGPYTLLNQIDSETNPEPSRKWRNSWKDGGSGDLEVDLTAARAEKMTEIRAKRDLWLKQSDASWVEESSKGTATTDIESDKTALRDMTDDAQTAVEAETHGDDLEAYDAFSGLTLNGTYE